jgi:hypothetical protein
MPVAGDPIALIWCVPLGARAQQPTTAPAQPLLKPAELDQLVAPIALHPDPLLSEILIASTYPLEVVQAERQRSFRLRSFSGRPGPNTTGRGTAGIKRAFSQTRLRGWAYRTRTGESGGELPAWICVTTWPEVGASRAAETLRVAAA